MKTLYIECNMGAAGDMLMSALSELIPDPDKFIKKMNSIGIPHIRVERKKAVKCGITGTHTEVLVDGKHEGEHIHEHAHNHTHEHHNIHDIEHIVHNLNVSEKIKKDIMSVYNLIAQAESRAHGKEVNEIHFHEVGTMDAIADITGVCMLIEEIAPDKIIASPVHVGCGQVKCAHGTLPVPAPATAHILRGVPIYGGEIQGELCTPTGAALLKHFASDFGAMPVMRTSKIGYGMGTKDFEIANCVRVMLGETSSNEENILELCCGIDDMTAEEIGFAANKIMSEGALDVFTAPIYMKKNRPGTLITCICRVSDKEKILSAIFRYTSTIGIREHICGRYVLDREEGTIETEYGKMRIKNSYGFGTEKSKIEYEDLAKIADEKNISLSAARKLVTENKPLD